MKPGSYCPSRYANDAEGFARWRAGCAGWKRKVPKRFARYARPEIFDLVQVARVFVLSAPWLEKRGFFELTPGEDERAEALLATDVGRVFKHGVMWMDYALGHLEKTDPQLALNLWKTPERYQAFAALARELDGT